MIPATRTFYPCMTTITKRRSFNPGAVVILLIAVGLALSVSAWAEGRAEFASILTDAGKKSADNHATGASGAAAGAGFFAEDVWVRVGAASCLKCHKTGGDAEDSDFLLRDPQRSLGAAQAEDMRHNRDEFIQMARLMEGDQPRMLMKVTGKLKHGGKEVLKPDSAGYRVLAEFVRRVHGPESLADASEGGENGRPFFVGIAMEDDQRLLRRVTLSLAGRLPTEADVAGVTSQGLKAMPSLLDAAMKEDAFYHRLREGFEDIFLTSGIDETDAVTASALTYEHFHKTRLWYQKHDLGKFPDKKAEDQARRELTEKHHKGMLHEPMRLIEHIVRNDRPFTEIVTADYIVVTPLTARAYGVYEEVKPQFKNPEDPFEYIPVQLKALVGSTKEGTQDSVTGFYPHAGLLSHFMYLRRYPTTETNRNRLRARVYFKHFLGVDVLDLAARVTDAAAVSAKYTNPTMQAAECVVCHKTLDPVAGLFQDYWRFDQIYGRRKEGWFTDMFAAGFEGEDLPAAERWRALQWLGERTAKDPRFAVAMVEHVHYLLTGRKVLLPPKDFEDPNYTAKRRAYREQRQQIEAMAVRFSQTGFNLKSVVKDWVMSAFYRADGLATAAENPARRDELDDVGVVHLLSPEQLERKVAAIFGKPWGKLEKQLAILYGGIDSREVTERATDPSGAMGAIQRILANDVARRETALDFSREATKRRLFRDIEPDVIPGSSAESDAKIRQAIVHLHQQVLGRTDTPDAAEVTRSFQLLASIVSEAAGRKGLSNEDRSTSAAVPDPHYTIRAWCGVLTYLLRQQEFLYE